MWPFRRRPAPRVESVRLGELGKDADDYPVLTVGQSRLWESFEALGFTAADAPRFSWAHLVPIVDPSMGRVADVSVQVDAQVVGYLRPPVLDEVVAALDTHRARKLEVPVVMLWTPAGPEVRVHAAAAVRTTRT